MTIALTLHVLDETLEPQVLFHLGAGADVVVLEGDAVDAGERFANDPRVGAGGRPVSDWMIAAGPGEFWWPRGGTLRDVLARVPAGYDAVQAVVRPLVAMDDGGGSLVERSIYRLPTETLLTDPHVTLRQFVSRARSITRPVRRWYPLEVLVLTGLAPRAEIERGIARGVVYEDTRLRDALARVRAGDTPVFPRPDVIEDALFAVDVAALGDADGFRLRDDLADLERRVTSLEAHVAMRVERRLRSIVRRGGRGA
jgi:hypothetical protein